MIQHVMVQLVILALQLLLLAGALSYIAYGVTRGISGYLDVPFVATPQRLVPIIAQALDIRSGDTVYDLGCGDGRLVLYCARQFPTAHFVGIERNPLLVLFARIRQKMLGLSNVTFRCEDIFKSDFSDATRIYAFLLPVVMDKLFQNPTASDPDHVRLVSRAFTITNRTSIQTIPLPAVRNTCGEHELHVYEW